jgi:hypothetical protein
MIFFDEDDDEDRYFLSEVRRRMGAALPDTRTGPCLREGGAEIVRLHDAARGGDVVAIVAILLLNGALTWPMLVGPQCGTA